MNSYIITDSGLSMSVGMKPYSVDSNHPNYDEIVQAIQAGDWDSIPELVNVSHAVQAWGGGKVEVDADHGVVKYNGEEIHNTLTTRILRMMAEGFSAIPLANFLENLMQNPSKRAVDELYTFLEYGKMPITEDGHFLAYKRVNDDYTSMHDRKTDNSVGKIVEMPRNKVDDRSTNTCSYGLHFCSHGYLKSFWGSKVVVLKINPRDVVSIPTDYNNTKGRACRYEVVGELSPEEVKKALGSSIWTESVNNDYEDADREIEIEGQVVSTEYAEGYEDGYGDGRAGGDAPSAVGDEPTDGGDFDDYVQGYVRGFKDGKGHRRKAVFEIDDDIFGTDEDTFGFN